MQITIKKSPKAKRWRLSVNSSNAVTLTIPRGFSKLDADAVLQKHSEWIRKVTDRQQNAIATASDLYRSNAPLLPLLGEWVKIDGDIESFYRKKARDFFEQTSSEIAQQLGVSYKKITIRDQKTRFGSYSSSGTLSYNWRVIKAPKEVAYYLAVHECSHILHQNHSAKFWQTVSLLSPNFKTHEAWLRSNTHFLRHDPWR